MKFGISTYGVIPVRIESSEQSEMVTQILFGELFKVVLDKEKWCKIETEFDQYEGWIDKKMCTFLSEEEFNELKAKEVTYTKDIFTIAEDLNDKTRFHLPGGSVLYNYNKKDSSFELLNSKYELKAEPFEFNSDIRDSLVEISELYLNSPYLWGGRNPFGIDCSGFTQLIFKMHGVSLPRDASQQVDLGDTLNFLTEAKPGDLAFFDNDDGDIIHVGLLLGQNKIIHASGKVRIDIIDHQGIFNAETKRYSHKLRVLKSIL